jgi:hypothetical protein
LIRGSMDPTKLGAQLGSCVGVVDKKASGASTYRTHFKGVQGALADLGEANAFSRSVSLQSWVRTAP